MESNDSRTLKDPLYTLKIDAKILCICISKKLNLLYIVYEFICAYIFSIYIHMYNRRSMQMIISMIHMFP